MIRYYIANMCEKSGEYSFDTLIRFALREPEKDFFNTPEEISYQQAEKYCDEIAQFWYDDDEGGDEEDENWWSFNGGEIAVKYGYHKQITEETFKDIASLISDLTSWEIRKELDEKETTK
jgi:hypothetical protein